MGKQYTGRDEIDMLWHAWSCELAQCITQVEPVQLTVIQVDKHNKLLGSQECFNQ